MSDDRRALRGTVAALAVLAGAGGMLSPRPVYAFQASEAAPPARVSVERRVLDTYPFSEPNPVPILVGDERLYPYHRFEGYAHASEPREWTVVHLENAWIELWVLPEIGGKVWGARVKATGHEFIYRNEVAKFRNIALRGPWTSGGIEFNFGVIGHTPSTATPVDYVTRHNEDGSASVFVGALDLPSRTRWRVEIRLPSDRAYFETNVVWQNPTPLAQPYYNWMTAAAFARDDLVLSIPGNAYLEHPGAERPWPVDAVGRRLDVYDENRFGGSKSYHVVGELQDFFGGYYRSADYGFGHWARYEEMPGQKLWLWALSRQGGIWEDLLTDSDGQYVEFQAGRLFVQYSPGDDVNPISQVAFDPVATDRWSETWFPVEGLGGLSEASREGAMHVRRTGGRVTVAAHAFRTVDDVVRVVSDGGTMSAPLRLDPLEIWSGEFDVPEEADVTVEIPGLGLRYASDSTTLALDRPFSTDPEAVPSIPPVARLVREAEQLVRGRRLEPARRMYERALAEEPWNREALLGLADLELRRGRPSEGLEHARRALQLDAYDARANFQTGLLFAELGRVLDAREAFGWAARSMAYRAAANVQLAELALAGADERSRRAAHAATFGETGDALEEARRYARTALDYDRRAAPAHRILAIVGRVRGDRAKVGEALEAIGALDPLDPFPAAELYLAARGEGRDVGVRRDALAARLAGEYPEQELLELAITYVRWGRREEAVALLDAGVLSPGGVPLDAEAPPGVVGPAADGGLGSRAVLDAWRAHLADRPDLLEGGADPAFAFPYRAETIPVLRWAVERVGHWSWRYLLALNLWGRDRVAEAAELLAALAEEPEYAPFYVARAKLAQHPDAGDAARTIDPEADLRRAVSLAPDDRLMRIALVGHLQAEGRWADALRASGEGLERSPDDFDLALLHAASLNETMRFEASIEVLDRVRVLPSEHSSAAHALFAQAHTMAALASLDRGDPAGARGHLETAMTWPEHLGQGRPYEPEERLQRYLLGVTLEMSGERAGAERAYEEVAARTPAAATAAGVVSRLDLLAAASLDRLGRREELATFGLADSGAAGVGPIEPVGGEDGSVARVVAAVRAAARAGRDLATAVEESARINPSAFADVEGRLLYRALTLGR